MRELRLFLYLTFLAFISAVNADEEIFWKDIGLESEKDINCLSDGNRIIGTNLYALSVANTVSIDIGCMNRYKNQYLLRITYTEDFELKRKSVIELGASINYLYKDYFVGEKDKRKSYAGYFIWGLGYAEYKKKNNHNQAADLKPNPYRERGVVIGFGMGLDVFYFDPIVVTFEVGGGIDGLMTANDFGINVSYRF